MLTTFQTYTTLPKIPMMNNRKRTHLQGLVVNFFVTQKGNGENTFLMCACFSCDHFDSVSTSTPSCYNACRPTASAAAKTSDMRGCHGIRHRAHVLRSASPAPPHQHLASTLSEWHGRAQLPDPIRGLTRLRCFPCPLSQFPVAWRGAA